MSNNTYYNPWAGLSSYQDPENSEVQLKFCGRDNESFDLMRLIDDNIFVTLYGKSGTGKTSLLNAGVFPRLRREQYLPVSIRLGMDAIGMSFQQCILTQLNRTLEGKGHTETIDVVPMPDDEQSPAYLWSYFARTRFVDNDESTLFPVVVFDQFEEVFRHRRQDAEALLRQIYFMMDENRALSDRMVDGHPYQYDFNFRFVASIREDDLYRLEDSIDNCYLPDMKRCRYRLRSLSEQGARDAILIPGEGLFKAEEQESIVKTIINIARNKDDDSISTNILSLICSRIFVDYQKSGAEFITPALVDTFVKGNPFERFYNEATRGFNNKEKSYIEDHLVDSTGRRNSVPESDFLLHVKNGSVLLEGSQKILQRTSVSSDGGNYRIELIHDSFCEPLVGQKDKREKRKRLQWLVGMAGIALVSITFVMFITYQINRIEKANRKILESQSRFIGEKALALMKEGDSYLARLLLLEVLPKNLKNPNRPFVSETALAFVEASQYNSAVLRGCNDIKGYDDYPVRYAVFSPDGKRIASESCNRVKVWDVNTGKVIWDIIRGPQRPVTFHQCGTPISFSNDGKYIISANMFDYSINIDDSYIDNLYSRTNYYLSGHDSSIVSVAISPDDNLIASSSIDKTIKLWNIYMKEPILQILEGHKDIINTVSFSPDGKYIVSASSDKTIRIWDIQTGKQIGNPLLGHTGGVCSASFSSDGSRIVSASFDKTIRIWNSKTGKQVGKTIVGHSDVVNSAYFSSDNHFIVSASDDKTIKIWDVSSGFQLGKTLVGHTERVSSARFSPDNKRIVSASDDKTIRIWDVDTTIFYNNMTKEQKAIKKNINKTHIVSISNDGKTQNWDFNALQELIDQTRERFRNRKLSDDERRKYYLE